MNAVLGGGRWKTVTDTLECTGAGASGSMTHASLQSISPFFIVGDVEQTIAFYRDRLGFAVEFQQPAREPFFAILGRDAVRIFVKAGAGVSPLPNSVRHPDMRWDAYVYVPEPDALAAEFAGRGAVFRSPLQDTHDGLRGFEIADADGYVLFFGRPRWKCVATSIKGVN